MRLFAAGARARVPNSAALSVTEEVLKKFIFQPGYFY